MFSFICFKLFVIFNMDEFPCFPLSISANFNSMEVETAVLIITKETFKTS